MRMAMMMTGVTASMMTLAACAGDGGTTATSPAPPSGTCNNDAVASYVGQPFTEQLGAEMLSASGGRAIRSGGPGTAMTMDYREDRLTVSYDEKNIIISARCG